MKYKNVFSGRILRFGLSGIVAAVAYYGVAWLSIEQFKLQVSSGSFLAYILATPIAYSLHRGFTFRAKGKFTEPIIRYGVSSVVGLGLSSLLPLLLMKLGLALTVSLSITCLLVPFSTYLIQSWWVFTQRSDHD
jgi:putative flippase GtrA